MPNDHDHEVFAAVVKAAMERGIDVPKIIAEQLRKKRHSAPPAVDASDPHAADPGNPSQREKASSS